LIDFIYHLNSKLLGFFAWEKNDYIENDLFWYVS